MYIKEFDALSDQEKLDFLSKEGTLFSNYQIEAHIWDTYKVKDFYVSVCFSIATNAKAITYVSYQPNEAFQYLKQDQQL